MLRDCFREQQVLVLSRPIRDPEEDVSDLIPAREAISKGEFSDTAQVIFHNTHE